MRLPRLRRGHSRWEELVSAHADGGLGPGEAARVEAHLAACSRCSAALADYQALRRLAAALPPVTAPRSFALTPEMAAGRARAPLGARPRMLVFAQAGAGLAVFALAVLLVADLGQKRGDDGQATTASLDEATGRDGGRDAGESTAGASVPVAPAAAATSQPTPGIPPREDGGAVGGQGVATTASPVPAGGTTLAVPTAAPGANDALSKSGGDAEAVGPRPEADFAPRPGDGGRTDLLRLAEYVAGGLALGAIAGALALRRRGGG